MNAEKIRLLSAYCLCELSDTITQRNNYTETELIPLLQFHANAHDVATELWDIHDIRNALTWLEARGYVEAFKYPYTANRYILTANGLGAYKAIPEDFTELLAIKRFGYEWLFEALTNIDIPPTADDTNDDLSPSEPELHAPASDRYVSTKDNHPAFTDLTERLSAIKNEYAKDHNRLAGEPYTEELISEIDAVLAQIERGKVRVGQITEGLLPTFTQACLLLSAYPGFVQLIQDAIHAAKTVLNLIGLSS